VGVEGDAAAEEDITGERVLSAPKIIKNNKYWRGGE